MLWLFSCAAGDERTALLPTTGDTRAQISLLTSHYSVGVADILESFDAAQLTPQQRLGALGHYHETEAAIVANRLNPELREVVVVYDSVTAQDNCTHLTKRLDAAMLSMDAKAATDFVCVDRVQGQPSYREMFEYASRLLTFTGQIVVMGNADGATDSTIGKLKGLEEGNVVVLSATGQFDSPAGAPATRVYEKLVGPLCATRPTSRCLVTDEERHAAAQRSLADGHPDEWRLFTFPEQLYSWDAYAFRSPLPRLNEHVLPDEIFMNHVGGENRAGLALLHALGRPVLPNACGHINWHHLHCNAQTHAVVARARTNVGMTLRQYDLLQTSSVLQTALHTAANITKPAFLRPVNVTNYKKRFASQLEETRNGLGTELRVEDTIVPFSLGCSLLADCLQLNGVSSTQVHQTRAQESQAIGSHRSSHETVYTATASHAAPAALRSRADASHTLRRRASLVSPFHADVAADAVDSYSYLVSEPHPSTAPISAEARPFVPRAQSVQLVPRLRQGDEQISLLTTHKAKGMSTLISMERASSGAVQNPLLKRYVETEAAIAANRLNPELREVVVVYDSVTAQDNCTHLTKRLDAAMLSMDAKAATDFVCVDRVQGQPSYREMFEYASRLLTFTGQIVVMGNADGATDSTIGKLKGLEEGNVVVLSATGQFDSPAGAPATRVYEKLVGPLCATRPTSRCLVTDEERHAAAQRSLADGHPDEWRLFTFPEQLYSWDAYAFRPPLPRLNEHILPPHVLMDRVGAGNRAGLALMQALGRAALIFNQSLPNACGHVNWHRFRCSSTAGEHAMQANAGMSVHEWTQHFPHETPPDMKQFGFERLDEQLNVVSKEVIEPWTTGCTDLLDCLRTVTPAAITQAEIAAAALRAGTGGHSRVVLHVGDVKTGSTHFQHLLHANAHALLSNGVLYPGVSAETNQAHHFLIADACQCNPVTLERWNSSTLLPGSSDFDAVSEQRAKPHARALRETLSNSGNLSILLSSEMVMPMIGESTGVALRLRAALTRRAQPPRIVYVLRNLKEVRYGAHKVVDLRVRTRDQREQLLVHLSSRVLLPTHTDGGSILPVGAFARRLSLSSCCLREGTSEAAAPRHGLRRGEHWCRRLRGCSRQRSEARGRDPSSSPAAQG